MTRKTLVVTGLAMILGSSAASAQQISGTLGAELTLTRACAINGSTVATGVNFGTLDFGTHPAIFTGVLTAQANTGLSATQILCSADVTSLSVTIDSGLHAGQGSTIGDGPRALRLGATTGYVPYEVYSTSGFTTPYPTNATGIPITISPVGVPFALPVYGRINKTSATGLTAGSYVDTLTVVIDF